MAVKINFLTIGFVEDGKAFKDFYDDLLRWRRENAFLPTETGNIQEDAD